MARLLTSHFVPRWSAAWSSAAASAGRAWRAASQTETIVEQAPWWPRRRPDPLSRPDPLQNLRALRPRRGVRPRQARWSRWTAPSTCSTLGRARPPRAPGSWWTGVGDILTNYHVIDGADRSKGITVEFENALVRNASVVAVDQQQRPRGAATATCTACPRFARWRGGLHLGARRRPDADDRQPVRRRPDADQRDRVRAPAHDRGRRRQQRQQRHPGRPGPGRRQLRGAAASTPMAGSSGSTRRWSPAAGEFAQRLAFAIPIDTADAILSRVNRTRRRRWPIWGSPRPPKAKAPARARSSATVAKDSPAQRAGTPGAATRSSRSTRCRCTRSPTCWRSSPPAARARRCHADPPRPPPAHRPGDAGQPDRARRPRGSSVAAVRTMWGVDPHAPRSSSAASPIPPTPTRRSPPAPGRWG